MDVVRRTARPGLQEALALRGRVGGQEEGGATGPPRTEQRDDALDGAARDHGLDARTAPEPLGPLGDQPVEVGIGHVTLALDERGPVTGRARGRAQRDRVRPPSVELETSGHAGLFAGASAATGSTG